MAAISVHISLTSELSLSTRLSMRSSASRMSTALLRRARRSSMVSLVVAGVSASSVMSKWEVRGG